MLNISMLLFALKKCSCNWCSSPHSISSVRPISTSIFGFRFACRLLHLHLTLYRNICVSVWKRMMSGPWQRNKKLEASTLVISFSSWMKITSKHFRCVCLLLLLMLLVLLHVGGVYASRQFHHHHCNINGAWASYGMCTWQRR